MFYRHQIVRIEAPGGRTIPASFTVQTVKGRKYQDSVQSAYKNLIQEKPLVVHCLYSMYNIQSNYTYGRIMIENLD